MAKRRRVRTEQRAEERSHDAASSPPLFSGHSGFDPLSIATGLLAATVVYISYYPSDSVAVERGDALWLAALAILIATVTIPVSLWLGESGWSSSETAGSSGTTRSSMALDLVAWTLALWMVLAALTSSPPGNLRMSTNEAWLWISAAAIFTSSRRLMVSLTVRQSMLALMMVCGVGLAAHGLHQYFISLPANRVEYVADPEKVLQQAGVEAPPGSAERMIFENRLFDGGPTATFALANSLAAVLLGATVLAVGQLRFGWRALTPAARIVWGMIALLCCGCLLAARSRSAILALLIGVVLVLFAGTRIGRQRGRLFWWGLGGVCLTGVLGAAYLALFGNREWFEEAPASLAFRFQYWRSTWNMVLDRPLVGAGPGNFQSIYERYREASATEQIAEPHNFFFETMASGGLPGTALLVGLVVIAFTFARRRKTVENDSAESEATQDRWVWLGALLCLMMIWLLGWASRRMPDLEASLYVLPLSIGSAFFILPSLQRLRSDDLDQILVIMLVAIGLHLTVAGGWTVPGVAMLIWLGTGMLTRLDVSAGSGQPRHALALAALIAGTLGLGTLYFASLRPVEDQKQWMALAVASQSRGQHRKALQMIEQAAEADPWSPDGILWLADHYRWRLIANPKDTEARRRWQSALDEAKHRGGDDPAVYRMIGVQQLHLYQRHGESADLTAAAETFQRAVAWSPSNQWMVAQWAVILGARGDAEGLESEARRAYELSGMGGNIERAMSRQQIYPATEEGARADRGPIRVSADLILPEPKSPP